MKNRLPFLFLFLCCLASLAQGQQIMVKAGELTRGLGTVKGYTDYAPLSSFQMGVKAEYYAGGGGASIGAAYPLDIQFTKHVDNFSNQLMYQMARQRSIPSMEIVWLVENSKGSIMVAHKVELSVVYVTEVMNSSAEKCTSCSIVAESYKVAYELIKRTLYKLDNNGNYVQSSEFSWNISQNDVELR